MCGVQYGSSAMDAEGSQLANLAGEEALSIRDMAQTIGRVLGKAPAIVDGPGKGDVVVGDTTLLRRLYRLPDRLTTFEEGVRTMIAA